MREWRRARSGNARLRRRCARLEADAQKATRSLTKPALPVDRAPPPDATARAPNLHPTRRPAPPPTSTRSGGPRLPHLHPTRRPTPRHLHPTRRPTTRHLHPRSHFLSSFWSFFPVLDTPGVRPAETQGECLWTVLTIAVRTGCGLTQSVPCDSGSGTRSPALAVSCTGGFGALNCSTSYQIKRRHRVEILLTFMALLGTAAPARFRLWKRLIPLWGFRAGLQGREKNGFYQQTLVSVKVLREARGEDTMVCTAQSYILATVSKLVMVTILATMSILVTVTIQAKVSILPMVSILAKAFVTGHFLTTGPLLARYFWVSAHSQFGSDTNMCNLPSNTAGPDKIALGSSSGATATSQKATPSRVQLSCPAARSGSFVSWLLLYVCARPRPDCGHGAWSRAGSVAALLL
ncbi:hypothetical protein P4O66_003444 [Electrophorus voltai]|uniref:Uncharacterized protein n=1 Tax=Electrophorus voltai TaxID=2609070 RepID=A0AAD9DL47_9TELE|nr:hypothetical protein P4O66_003444 [Electrophorus voltai]